MKVETYPGWQSTRKFTIGVRSDVLAKSNSGNFSFDTATQIVEEIGERYGHWQDAECRDLKRLLSKYENAGTGRVLLKDWTRVSYLNHSTLYTILGGFFSELFDSHPSLGLLRRGSGRQLAVLGIGGVFARAGGAGPVGLLESSGAHPELREFAIQLRGVVEYLFGVLHQ
eukprot:g22997.t1